MTKNAIITLRNRRCELKLTFEFAQHMMDNYIHDVIENNKGNRLQFLDIQRVAKRCKYVHKTGKTYIGRAAFNDGIYQIIITLDKKDAVVVTNYKL